MSARTCACACAFVWNAFVWNEGERHSSCQLRDKATLTTYKYNYILCLPICTGSVIQFYTWYDNECVN